MLRPNPRFAPVITAIRLLMVDLLGFQVQAARFRACSTKDIALLSNWKKAPKSSILTQRRV
jgi:hypothetical protein